MLNNIYLISTLFLFRFYSSLAGPISFKTVCPIVRCNGTDGSIESFNFPGNYSNELDCITRITVQQGYLVQLIFYTFDTEFGSDIVTLYDGFGPMKKPIVQLSGLEPMHYIYKTTESNILSVEFKTDIDNTRSGYYGYFNAISPTNKDPILTDCSASVEYTDSYGVIVSPLWPSLYPNEKHCVYKINLPDYYGAIDIKVNFFETEENADIVAIYNGDDQLPDNVVELMSGQYPNGYKIHANSSQATIVFISDFDDQYRGYSFTYTGIPANINSVFSIK